jgi:hypothetical protein
VIAIAVGGLLAIFAIFLGSCVVFGALFLHVVNGGMQETAMGRSAELDLADDDDDADDDPDVMVIEDPQPPGFPFGQQLAPPDRSRRKAHGPPVNDGLWRAYLTTRKTAEAQLFSLADQLDARMTELATAQRASKPDELNKATQEMEKVRQLMAAEHQRVNVMGWAPLDSRTEADLLAERKALIEDLKTLANPPEARYSKQFKLRAAEQRRTRIDALDDALGN